jgi:D-cysteine desulfhydrase
MSLPYPQRVSLANLPTPVQKLKKISRELGVDIYVKRDDMTGIELSGNKVRKLEFLLAEALECGADTIVTTGGIQSNHCRATAAACVRLGLKCHLILRSEKPEPPFDGNLLLNYLLGAEISYIPPPEFQEYSKTDFKEVQDKLRSKGNKTFYFPVGGSVPTGCWGYALAFEETLKQLDEIGVNKAHLIIATGSGGTQTGLMIGRALMKRPEFKITGFNVCDTPEFFQDYNCKLFNETSERFNLNVKAKKEDFNLIGDYVGPGYAQSYPELMECIKMVAAEEALVIDPVYTGKAFYGLLSEIKKGNISKDEPIVFIHTGGLFGLFPQRDLFRF